MLNAAQLKAALTKIKEAIDDIEGDFDPDEFHRLLERSHLEAKDAKESLETLCDTLQDLCG